MLSPSRGLVLLLPLLLLLCACATGGTVRTQSIHKSVALAPRLPTVAYSSTDRNTADIYLTDLSETQLDPGADLAGITGDLIHIHLFLLPSAGDTPIEDTACSATIRHFVMSHGQIGVYGGGGFLNPSRRPGADTISGDIRGATLKLVQSTPGFQDLLGPCDFSASFRAPRDESLAAALGDRLADILEALAKTPPHAPPATAAPSALPAAAPK